MSLSDEGLDAAALVFLFTDLENSTVLWDRAPARMSELLAIHDERMTSRLRARSGSLFKHTGDGLIATFTTAADAVQCAVEMQRDMADLDVGPDPLRVRMGVHAGTVQRRAGDLFGAVLNRAARIMSAAHGGQIIVSDLIRQQLTNDDRATGVEFEALGVHRLKGFTLPEALHQVCAPGLRREFPPPASMNATMGTLPTFPDTMVNRTGELAELVAALSTTRVVSIVGPGGVGKTRLALHAARLAATASFPDGAWFVDLAPVSDHALVASTIATAMSVSPRAGQDIVATLRDALSSRRALLVLDNCEYVHEAVAAVLNVALVADTRARVLCTSQIPLGVASERLVRIGPLVVPDELSELDLADLRTVPSVALFEERAMLADPDFAITEENRAAVVEICRQLDGLPLALELAAARCQVLSPESIAGRLDRRFSLLRAQHGANRQRTLLATLEWTHELLTADERSLLAVLGVFRTESELGAIAHVADLDELEVVDLVAALVDKSLLTTARGPVGLTYRLLETTRQFALERLAERDDVATIRGRYDQWFVALARRARRGLLSDDAPRWLHRLTTQLPDVRVAVDSLMRSDPALAAEVVCGLQEMWLSREIHDEARAWLESLSSSLAGEPIAIEVDTLLSSLTWIAGDSVAAEAAATRALAVARTNGTTAPRAAGRMAVLRVFQGHPDEALAYAREAHEAVADDPEAAQAVLGVIGVVTGLTGDGAAGRSLCETGVTASRAFGPIRTATALANLETHLGISDPDRSMEIAAEAVQLGRLIGSKAIEAHAHLAEAQALRARRDRGGSRAAVAAALPLLRDSGRRQMVVMSVEIASRDFRRDAPAAAATIWAATARLRAEIGEPGTPQQRQSRLDNVQQLRDLLGETAFQDSWQRGEAMSLDELVETFCATVESLDTEYAVPA